MVTELNLGQINKIVSIFQVLTQKLPRVMFLAAGDVSGSRFYLFCLSQAINRYIYDDRPQYGWFFRMFWSRI